MIRVLKEVFFRNDDLKAGYFTYEIAISWQSFNQQVTSSPFLSTPSFNFFSIELFTRWEASSNTFTPTITLTLSLTLQHTRDHILHFVMCALWCYKTSEWCTYHTTPRVRTWTLVLNIRLTFFFKFLIYVFARKVILVMFIC